MCGVSARTTAPRVQILHLQGQATAWEHVTMLTRLRIFSAPTALREETFSMLYAGNGDYAPDAIIYDMLIDEPAIYILGRCEQKGC